MPTYSSFELSSAKALANNHKHALFKKYRPSLNVRSKRTFEQIEKLIVVINANRFALKVF
jgi:hypothetical protein